MTKQNEQSIKLVYSLPSEFLIRQLLVSFKIAPSYHYSCGFVTRFYVSEAFDVKKVRRLWCTLIKRKEGKISKAHIRLQTLRVRA